MKITHAKLRRIILEELKLISEEGSDWEKDRAAVVRGPDYKRKRQIRLDQQRKSSQRQKEREGNIKWHQQIHQWTLNLQKSQQKPLEGWWKSEGRAPHVAESCKRTHLLKQKW